MFVLVSTHSAYVFRSAYIDMICMKIEVPGKIGVFLNLWQWPAACHKFELLLEYSRPRMEKESGATILLFFSVVLNDLA